MPRMDGYQCTKNILKILKKNGLTKEEEIPKIYALTGHVEPEYKLLAIKSGMLTVYSKPISMQDLQIILLDLCFEIQLK